MVGITLDHDAYPHIFDAIIAYAAPTDLLPLRLTCKSVCDRVDGILAHHVVIRCRLSWEKPDFLTIRGPDDAPVPGFRMRPYPNKVEEGLQASEWAANEARLRQILSNARVVDFWGRFDAWPETLLSALSNVETVRLRRFAVASSTKCVLRPKNCILFAEPEDLDIHKLPFDGNLDYMKFVVNIPLGIDDADSYVASLSYINTALPEKRPKLVVVFSNVDPGAKTATESPPSQAEPPEMSEVVEGILIELGTELLERPVTIVGLAQLDPSLLGFTSEPSVTELSAKMMDRIEYWQMEEEQSTWTEEQFQLAAANVTFLTEDEYTAQLDHEQWLLETVQ